MIADKEISINAWHDGILALMWFASLACSPCVIKHGIAGTKGTSCAQADICKRETVMPPNAGVMAVYSVNAVMKAWTFQYSYGFGSLRKYTACMPLMLRLKTQVRMKLFMVLA